MAPPPRARIRGSTARTRSNRRWRWWRSTRSHVARSTSSASRSVRKSVHAALWSRRSTPPNAAPPSATMAVTAAGVGHVAPQPDRLVAGVDQFRRHRLGAVAVAVGDGHPGAECGQMGGGGRPDPAGGPGDDGDLAVQGAHLRPGHQTVGERWMVAARAVAAWGATVAVHPCTVAKTGAPGPRDRTVAGTGPWTRAGARPTDRRGPGALLMMCSPVRAAVGNGDQGTRRSRRGTSYRSGAGGEPGPTAERPSIPRHPYSGRATSTSSHRRLLEDPGGSFGPILGNRLGGLQRRKTHRSRHPPAPATCDDHAGVVDRAG